MGTYIDIPITGITNKKKTSFKTYLLDFNTGRIKGFVDGLDACKQYIRKAILTSRFKCLIYSNQYGSEVKQIMTEKEVSPAYIAAEFPRIIKDSIINDERILNVDTSAFVFNFVDDGVYVDFGVDTIYGEIRLQEVLKIV